MKRLNRDMELHFIELKKFLRAAGNKPASELTKMERWMGYLQTFIRRIFCPAQVHRLCLVQYKIQIH